MKTNTTPNYQGFRFPPEIISHAVWLYFRFSLSFRDIEELLAQRGIVVSYETVRQHFVNLEKASLKHANLSASDLSEADLSYANLADAELINTLLFDATLRYANLSN